MSGSPGDHEGIVYLAHAWCPREHRNKTVGGWHWWNVYKTEEAALMQAMAVSRGWKEYGKYSVKPISDEAEK